MRTAHQTLSALLIAFALTVALKAAAIAQRDRAPSVVVVKRPGIVLPPRVPDTPEEAARIRGLISRLAGIGRSEFGISATMSEPAFAPVAGAEKMGMLVLVDQELQAASAFFDLVKLGPKAMPYLLSALKDSTPTKLTLKRESAFGWIAYHRELWGSNPANPAEKAALAAVRPPAHPFGGDGPDAHTVTVGDVCFVLIGQIVGRRYSAVRPQPTGGMIFNSPTHDPLIAGAVQKIWSSPHPDQHLLNSLLLDYSSHGVATKPGEAFDRWDIGSDLQVAAALRLLTYFPEQTVPFISNRLRNLKVYNPTGKITTKKHDELYYWSVRELANGVRTDEFIKAVAWCPRPEIRSALEALFAKTDDPELAVLCLAGRPAMSPAAIRGKLSRLLKVHADDEGQYGNAYRLLVALGRYGGPEAKSIFKAFLRPPRVNRVRAMNNALREVRPEWAVELLAPFLTDKRTFGWDYAVAEGNNSPRLLIRLCDESAETLATVNKDLAFRMEGTYANLDKQIGILRAKIQAGEGR